MSLPEGSPHPPIPLSLQTTVERGIQETTEAERSPRTSPQPPPVRATARASTSRDSREHRHRKVTGERATLHNLAPPRHLHPAVPPLSRPRWECGGGARGDKAGHWGPAGVRRTARSWGWGPKRGLSALGCAAGEAGDAGRSRGGPGAGPGRAGVPTLPAGCKLPARPSRLRPGPLRGAPVTRLTCVALWNCFLSPATDMVRDDARAAAAAGRRRQQSRAGGPSRAARSPGRHSSCRRRGCGRGGAEPRGTRARAERHPDVRGG